jgi:hypothetical protein
LYLAGRYDDMAVNIESTIETSLESISMDSLNGVYLNMRPVMNLWPHVVYEGASLSRVFRLYQQALRHVQRRFLWHRPMWALVVLS